MCTSFCASPSSRRPVGMPVHLLTSLAISSSSTSSFSIREPFLNRRGFVFGFRNSASAAAISVAYLGDFGEFAGPFVALFFRFQLVDLFLSTCGSCDRLFFRLPTSFLATRFFLEGRQLFFNLCPAFLGVRVGFPQHCLAFDFELQNAALDFVNFCRNESICMRRLAAASSIRSIALSGRKRSEM